MNEKMMLDDSIKELEKVEEKEMQWLIPGYMPRGQIIGLVGDGGCGKSTSWVEIAAAVSAGRSSFLLEGKFPETFGECKPERVMIFSAEDSIEYVLKRRLRKNGANMKNICALGAEDRGFDRVQFNSIYLEQLIEKYRPALCIFDPIQSFLDAGVKMSERNAMRKCLTGLVRLGGKYGTTFLIVVHTNKQSSVAGRQRMADSSDIWDICRSVLFVGKAGTSGLNYLSQEKSNYGRLEETVLYRIEDEVVTFEGYTNKKDLDFVMEKEVAVRQAPRKEGAKLFIVGALRDGAKEMADLQELAKIEGISNNALRNAKSELRNEGKIRIWSQGFNPKRFYIALTEEQKSEK